MNIAGDILNKLNIYEKKNAKFTECLIRKKEILISAKPEEIVRQIFLYFLVNESGLFPNLIDIKVEFNHRDIEVYKVIKHHEFKPLQSPVMIVEVKREEENLLNHENQIIRYLKESHSEIGILFNCNQIIGYIKQSTGYIKNYLNCLADIPPLILPFCNKIEEDISEFEKAKNGNFNSFTYLLDKYGQRAVHQIAVKLKSVQSPIVGYFFRVIDNKVYYHICGKYSSKQNLFFEYQDFERLISITYGELKPNVD